MSCNITNATRLRLSIKLKTTTDVPSSSEIANSAASTTAKVMQAYQLTVGSYLTAYGGPTNSSATIFTLVKAT